MDRWVLEATTVRTDRWKIWRTIGKIPINQLKLISSDHNIRLSRSPVPTTVGPKNCVLRPGQDFFWGPSSWGNPFKVCIPRLGTGITKNSYKKSRAKPGSNGSTRNCESTRKNSHGMGLWKIWAVALANSCFFHQHPSTMVRIKSLLSPSLGDVLQTSPESWYLLGLARDIPNSWVMWTNS